MTTANPRVFSSILLGLAFALVSIGMVTMHWKGGSLFDSQSSETSQTAVACGGLLVVGDLLWLAAFIIGLVQFCSKEDWGGRHGLTFFYLASLYLGTTFNFVAIIVYTTRIAQNWSYLLCVIAWSCSLIVSIMAMLMCRCKVERP